MARSRNIKPGFFHNDLLAEKHPLTRILFAALWPIADREGRLEDRPKKIKALCLPFDDHDVEAALDDLAGGPDPFIQRYEVDGRKYLQVVNWPKHQSPHVREPDSVIPPAPDLPVPSTSQAHAEPVGSGLRVKGIRNQESGKEEGAGETTAKRFTPPTVEDVRAYCTERKNKIDAQAFVDFYESKGWKVGNQSMKSWKASVRTWESNNRGARGSPTNGKPGFSLGPSHIYDPNTETRNEI